MLYEIVELQRFSGSACTIYSVIPKGSPETLFDEFLHENATLYGMEVGELLSRLKQIGESEGLREGYYKSNEGRLGDNICALYDTPGGRLRLYFIKYGNDVIIIGGGGYKDKEMRAWQDDPILSSKMHQLMAYADHIGKRIEKGDDLSWTNDLRYLEGDLNNDIHEEDDQS